jgi:two-component system, NarL family, sensor kinase
VAQEALTNVHRHSKSSTVKIRLSRDPSTVVLEIHDRGQGVPPHILEGCGAGLGVGISGMRERVRQLGGRLELLSDPQGTTVRAILPVRSE